ncbi:uncharacterized protein LOC141660036 [Apium graveolens]|uniref:uncharacterized protein LOC141660036 n=1 Tax=Apium graveolens TaxID=4045 RepID=UPI003D78C0E5
MRDTEQLDDFCMRLNGLVTNIRVLGETIVEDYIVKKPLRAVPTKFLQITSAVEQFGNLETMSVEEVVGSLNAHEERLKGQTENSEGQQLLLTEDEWLKRESNDGKLLLTREEWLRRSGKGAQEGSGGDYRYRKPKKNRQQRGEANLALLNDEEPALLMALCENDKNDVIGFIEGKTGYDTKRRDENMWYIDNGASNHMTGQREKFEKLDKTVKGEVKFGDGFIVKIEGKGTIRIMCKNGETRLLYGVYYIPTLRSNIISLGQLSEEGNHVFMNGENIWVYDSYGRMLIQVQRSANRLYKIHIQEAEHHCLLTKSEDETWL